MLRLVQIFIRHSLKRLNPSFTVYCLTETKNQPIFKVKPVIRITVFPQNSILLSAVGRW
jgi:hypothetical protein